MSDRGGLRAPDQLRAALRRELVRHVNFSDELAVDVGRARSEIEALTAEAAASDVAPDLTPQGRKTATRRRRALARAQRQLLVLLRAHGLQSQRIADLVVKLQRWRSACALRRASSPRLSIVA